MILNRIHVTLSGILRIIIYFGLLAFTLFQLYTAIYGQFPAQIQRTVHLGFGLTFVFLTISSTS